VSVSLKNLEIAPQREIVKGVGELAQPSSDGGDDATFAQFPAVDEPSAPGCAADLPPEAKSLSGRYEYAIEFLGGHAEVLDLAEL